MAVRISKRKVNIEGKTERYNQYLEAWERIKEASKKGFYLEAITIQESIMNDRLISHLKGIKEEFLDDKGKQIKKPRFGLLIGRAKLKYPTEKLFRDMEAWSQQRNKAIHRIVRIGVVSIDDFLEEAKACAENGEKLAREVSRWHSKQKPKLKKNPLAP
jgi:hypothetical protein